MKRTGRTLDRTLESQSLNNREVLTETIGSSGNITLIVSHDESMGPVGHAAMCRTRLTFVEAAAISVNKSTNLDVRTKVDKKDIAPELQPLLFGSPSTLTGLIQNGLPQLAEPAIEAEGVYAFVGECECPGELYDFDGKWIKEE
ncbi:hypothetical protein PHMEG_00010240 [Phytophthora megakarya]|uniref:Uncharacterized protein n=1 Tax=Phytophthora megakarya TaxID=4795 RepID=A0A225WGM6_9STRA|nr:hypothetical protein PHMEG_00010240 [Phytophthora megakarya]